jgi:hypothetical protein
LAVDDDDEERKIKGAMKKTEKPRKDGIISSIQKSKSQAQKSKQRKQHQ